MKLLVMSDSHSSLEHMLIATEKTKPDAIVHLGDHINDAKSLKQRFPDIPFYMVIGNMDFGAPGDVELFLTIDGVNILVTHGHIYGVKEGFDRLVERAQGVGADVVLYGHTHQLSLREEQGRTFLCPGQMQHHFSVVPASFGIVNIENGSFQCSIEKLELEAKEERQR